MDKKDPVEALSLTIQLVLDGNETVDFFTFSHVYLYKYLYIIHYSSGHSTQDTHTPIFSSIGVPNGMASPV